MVQFNVCRKSTELLHKQNSWIWNLFLLLLTWWYLIPVVDEECVHLVITARPREWAHKQPQQSCKVNNYDDNNHHHHENSSRDRQHVEWMMGQRWRWRWTNEWWDDDDDDEQRWTTTLMMTNQRQRRQQNNRHTVRVRMHVCEREEANDDEVETIGKKKTLSRARLTPAPCMPDQEGDPWLPNLHR